MGTGVRLLTAIIKLYDFYAMCVNRKRSIFFYNGLVHSFF